MRIFVMVAMAALLGGGCSTLTPGSSRATADAGAPKETTLVAGTEFIELVSFVSEDRLAGYAELKTIECRLGMNFSDPDTNVAACENHLRNEAFRNGASIAWLRPEWRKVGNDKGCDNCVEMRAMLLVPKPPPSKSARKPR
jgi:hypothetical protein